MRKVTISAMMMSGSSIGLFFADGKTDTLGSASWRTRELVDKIAGPLAEHGKVEIDLDDFVIVDGLKEATNGTVKIEGNDVVAGKTRITNGAQALAKNLERVVHLRDAKGIKLFLKDFARIPHKHSADELLKFMENNDLPIADDGSLIVYKFLDAKEKGVFADHHSGRVLQRLGSLVRMPVGQVNDSRRTDCSTGLHVCGAKYGSYGDTVFLAKVRAGDVIAVPEIETGKMRVAAYHLVAILDKADYAALINKRESAALTKGQKLVAKVIAGNHVGVMEIVEVGGSVSKNSDTPIKTRKVSKKQAENKGKGKKAKTIWAPEKPAKTAQPPLTAKEVKAKAAEGARQRKADEKLAVKGTYEDRLARAFELIDDGYSQRDVCKRMKLDRESFGKKVKARGRK